MEDTIAEDDRNWEAERDARTLADAEEIMQDPGRVTSAKKAAKKLADERDAEAQAMNAVAGREGDIEKAVRNGGAVMGAIPLSHYRR